ncbi:MAG: hypothetical protein ABJ246_08775 [Paracoccaceae bacterium]
MLTNAACCSNVRTRFQKISEVARLTPTRFSEDHSIMVDKRAICGARNNADWYEIVFSAHGLKYQRQEHAFVAHDLPPPYYSKLTVLSPNQAEAITKELIKLAKQFDGVLGLKDSFCQLDLTDNGFETLFEATWIWRSARASHMPDDWEIVRHPNDLAHWEDSWKSNGSPEQLRMFPASLLNRDEVFFLGRRRNGRFDSGCIANRSSDCVGLFNVFAEQPSQHSFSQAADAVSAICGELPIVGYESGDELSFAELSSFDLVGPLRILVTRTAKF